LVSAALFAAGIATFLLINFVSKLSVKAMAFNNTLNNIEGGESMKERETKMGSIYELEGRIPVKEALPLGMQHVLAMFAGNLAPLLVIFGVINVSDATKIMLLQNSMFIAGLITLIQLYPVWKIGSGLPVVMGTSSGFIPVGLAVGSTYGYGAVLGASLLGGIIEFCLGFIIKPLRKILPHVVTGTVVMVLGISLIPIGIQYLAGGTGMQNHPSFGSPKNLFVGFLVFALIIALQHFGKGFIKLSAILLGIIIGFIVSIFMGMVDFTPVAEAAWISIPKPIFMMDEISYQFNAEAIIPFVLVFLATTVETIGDNTGIAVGGLGRDITDKELTGAVFADGFGSAVASVFGVMPNTSFSQNVGIVGMTKIVNRFVLMTGCVFLMCCGLIPKLGALIKCIPNPVLGGAVLIMFAMISISGLNLLIEDGIGSREGLIIAASMGIAFGLSNVPQVTQYLPTWIQSMFGQAIVGAFVTATILNLCLPKKVEKQNKAENNTVNV
jgi:NCS2 family nucleobase:cation symporter-2